MRSVPALIRPHLAAAALLMLLATSVSGCGVFCHFNNSCDPAPDCNNAGLTSPSGNCDADPLQAGSKTLPIAPVFQQTLAWCWLASAEMIFTYYRVPPVNGISYQCGIMGAVTGPASACFYNCTLCVFGSGSDAASARVLIGYPQIAQQFFPARVPQVNATLFERRLTRVEIQREIDAGHPIELGITPTGPFQGQAAHDVVLIGYSVSDNKATMLLTINDPAPYDLLASPVQNPYRLAGGTVLQPWQYQISYDALASSLQWSASITTSSY